MEVYSKGNIFKNVLVLFFLILIFFNILGLSSLNPWREYGQLTDKVTLFYGLLLFFISSFIYKFPKREYMNISLYLGLFAGIYVLGHIFKQDYENNIPLFLILLTCIFILTSIKIKWEKHHLIISGHVSMIFIIGFFLNWIDTGLIKIKYMAVFNNPNVFAIFLFCILYFILINLHYANKWFKLYFIFGIILNILLIYLTTSRTVLLSVMIVFISFILLNFSRKIFSLLFYLILGFNLIFVTSYLYFSTSHYREHLNNLSLKYLHKPFFSGREEIWLAVYDFAMSSPFIGHKVGINLKEYWLQPLYDHAHNQYLQILVESGFIGLIVFLLILYAIWKQYLKNLNSHLVKWSACFFIAILFYQNIELSLFIHFPSIGYLQWLIIAIGFSSAIRDKSTKSIHL
jgi:O-antigen ligase